MAVALDVVSIESGSRRKVVVEYALAFAGNYIQEASNPNEVLNLKTATDTLKKGYRVPSRSPELLELIGAPGGNPGKAVIGATPDVCYLKLYKATHAELDAGAYNAAVTGDTGIRLRATWQKGRF